MKLGGLILVFTLIINATSSQDLSVDDLKQGTVFLVKFGQGMAKMDPSAKTNLDIIVNGFEKFDDLQIEVAGHTDFRGDAKANQKLAKLRAKIVSDYLIAQGTPKKSVKTVSYGGERPLSKEIAEMNRRVEITVLKNSSLGRNYFGVSNRSSESFETDIAEIPVPSVTKDQFSDAKKLALVIGNGNYTEIVKLKNPTNDADLMQKTLTELGFEVYDYKNLSYTQMIDAIKNFSYELHGVDIVLFYFAGHGLQFNGSNYLLPVDVELKNGSMDLTFEAINSNIILKVLEYTNEDNLNILILDACRNTPFLEGNRSMGNGLVELKPPTGSVIAYATSPGSVAFDGEGNNGVYTLELTKQMVKPQRIEDVFMNTRINVEEVTNMEQSPWELFRLRGIYYFNK